MKKFLIILIVSFSLGLIPVGCGNCVDKYLGKYEVDLVNIQWQNGSYFNYSDSNKYVYGVDVDTFSNGNNEYAISFVINSNYNKIANCQYTLYPNNCYAYKKLMCIDSGFFTLKHKIDSIILTCDTVFNNKPANTLLDTSDYIFSNNSQKIVNIHNVSTNLPEWIHQLNSNTSYAVLYDISNSNNIEYYLYFIIKRKDNSNDLSFRLKIYLDDGRVLEATTKKVHII